MKLLDFVNSQLKELFNNESYHLIVLAITGSNAYGINTKDSDIDVQGIVIPPIDYIIGTKHFKQYRIPKTIINKTEVEGMIFGFEKWYNLYYKQNPNILEIMWHEDSQYIYRDDQYWPLLFNKRSDFLSLKIKHTFSGYAHAQFHRLSRLNQKANQNSKRLEEFEKFGYSVKNAAHLIRLLNMALEILVEHRLYVIRPERQLLMSIRDGNYSFEDIKNMSDQKQALVEKAYISSTLRRSVDFEIANKLKVSILSKFIGENI